MHRTWESSSDEETDGVIDLPPSQDNQCYDHREEDEYDRIQRLIMERNDIITPNLPSEDDHLDTSEEEEEDPILRQEKRNYQLRTYTDRSRSLSRNRPTTSEEEETETEGEEEDDRYRPYLIKRRMDQQLGRRR